MVSPVSSSLVEYPVDNSFDVNKFEQKCVNDYAHDASEANSDTKQHDQEINAQEDSS